MTSGTAHYGLGAVSRSLRHFVVGKTFTVVSALVVLFVLARVLEPAAYAAYVALQALVVLMGRMSGFGVQKVMSRYLPELRATANHVAAYRLLLHGTLLRAGLVGLFVAVALVSLPALGRGFGLENWLWLLPWYLAAGYLRLMNQWLGTMLESFLWQRESQYSLAAGGVAKLAAVLLMADGLALPGVVAIDLGAEVLMAFLLVGGSLRRWRMDPARNVGDTGWWRSNRSRALRYGTWGFLQNQSGLFYGSAPNRLVAAHYLPSAEVALFGVADNLINLVRRFMPTQLFIGLIRPVAIARFSASGDFASVAWISALAYRLNLMLLVLGIAVLIPAGTPLFAWLTAGRYPEAAWLVAALLVLMATEGMRTMVELMAQVVERNQVFFWSNLLQSASLLLAIPLVMVFGLWGLIVANITGTVLANVLVIGRLRAHGYRFHFNLPRVAMIFGYGTVAAGLGWLAIHLGGVNFFVVGGGVAVTYTALCLVGPPLERDERKLLLSLIRRKAKIKTKPEPDTDLMTSGVDQAPP